MKVYQLVATCQNQWFGNVFSKNKNFKLTIQISNKKRYNFLYNYSFNDKWLEVNDLEVSSWQMEDTNHLIIKVNA